MSLTNRPLTKGIVLLLLAALLVSCGGKEERKAKYLERGKAYLAEKNYGKARVEFKNVLQIDPKDAEGYRYVGETFEKELNWEKAYANYQKALQLDPELIEPRIRLANFYLAQASALKNRGDRDREANALGLVQEQIKEIRARDADNDEALTLEASLWVNDGNIEKATPQLEEVISRNAGLQSAAVLLSSIYDREGRVADAEAVLINAAQGNPAPNTLRQRLAALYVKHKQNDKAEAVLRQIVEENPDELSYRVSLASFLNHAEQADKAEQVLKEAIAADPEDAQRYLLLIELLGSTQGQQAAIARLEQFAAELPDLTELKLSLVRLYLEAGQEDKARTELDRIIDEQGSRPAGLKARVVLAQMLASRNMDDEQVSALLSEVLAENPRDNDALLLKGKLAANHRRFVDAINDFRSVLKDQPGSAEVSQLLAAAHVANNERELALDTLRRSVEANPGSTSLRLSLSQLLRQGGDIDPALEQLDEALRIDADNQAVLKAKFELLALKEDAAGMEEVARQLQQSSPDSEVGFLEEARLRMVQQDYDAALALLGDVLAKHPQSLSALVLKSDALAAQKKYPDAIAVIETLQKVLPDSGEGYYRKGRLLAEQGDLAAAAEQYEIALQKAPGSVEALGALVDLEVRQGKTEDARQRLKTLLQNNPRHSVANGMLGVIYMSDKDYPAAASAFSRQLEINPRDTMSYVRLAQARLGAGDSAGAAQAYEQGLKQMPDDIRLLLGLAGLREQQKDYDTAITLYEKVLEIQPGNALSTNNLAALLADYRSDEASLARAAELSSDLEKTSQPAFLDTAAWVYYRRGEYEKAIGLLEQAVEQAPKVPIFQYHLGMAYYKLGNKDAAREHLTNATRNDAFTYNGVEEARATLKTL